MAIGERQRETGPISSPGGRPPPGGFARAFSSLRYKNYRWYFISGLGMTGAQGIQQLAFALLVLDLTGSVGQLGLVVFVRGLPMAVIALFGGVMADRYNRRNLLIYNQLFTMINLVILAALTMAGVVHVWHIYVSSIILGITSSVTMPARQSLIRSLVGKDEMMNAVALNSFQQTSSRIIWPTMAGGLITFLGIGATLMVCAGGYLVGIVFLFFIRDFTQEYSDRRRSTWSELGEGLHYIKSTPLIAMVLTLALSIGCFGLAYMQMGPGFAHQVLHFNAAETGLFMMASGVGSIIGSTAFVVFEPRKPIGIFVGICAIFGVSLLGLALNPWTFPAFIWMGWFGFATAGLSVCSQTIFQTEVPPHLLGRVLSLWSMAGGLGSVSALPIGIVGDAFGLRWALGAVAVAMLAVTLYMAIVRLPKVRLLYGIHLVTEEAT
jgi:MFS family permease